MGLTKVFLRLIALVFAATLFVPLVTAFCSRLNDPAPWTAAAYVTYPALALVLAGVGLLFARVIKASEARLDAAFVEQTRIPRYVSR